MREIKKICRWGERERRDVWGERLKGCRGRERKKVCVVGERDIKKGGRGER